MRADQDKDSKGKDKDFQDVYKSMKSTREAMVFTDNKCLAVEHAVAEVKAVRERPLSKLHL